MTSPVLMPARAAGLSATTFATSAPLGRCRPRLSAISGVTSCSLAPSQGRLHRSAAAFRRGDHHPHHIRRDGEADALRSARARVDRRIDADHPPAHVDQRTAGIAGIDGGIGLNEELIVADADCGARHRRDDAVGDRLADAERIADRQHHVADLQLVGIGERQSGKALLGALDAQHRKIAALILEHDVGGEFALVGQRDLHFAGALDDVIIGDDETGRIDDDAGAERALDLLAAARRRRTGERTDRPGTDCCSRQRAGHRR